jgi:ferrous iron transport protein B
MKSCHTPSNIPNNLPQSGMKKIALLGMPNTGKSTFFNRITGASAHVGNWPGITLDLLEAVVKLNGVDTEIIDLPGIYDLSGFSDDEKIVRNFLENYPVDLIITVINASQIDHQIRLPLQVKKIGFPAVLIVNMADEAKQYGVIIDPDSLSQKLEMPVCLMSAKHGQGYMNAYTAISQELAKVPTLLPIAELKARIENQRNVTETEIHTILENSVIMPSQIAVNLTEKIDRFMLHPVWGLPLFFLGMFGIFWLIWSIGLPAQDVMDNITGRLLTNIIEPLVIHLPEIVQNFLINGVWNGLATVASFVPLIVLFFMLMAVLEDSGYLSRSAYLMDGLMAKLGLDGRSFVMQMMGFGCNVPALMGTRVMRSPALRLLTMLTIPFSLCSARLQVFVFIIVAVYPNQNGAIVLFSLYLLSFVAAIFTALLFQGKFPNQEPFVLELPPYRWPTPRHVLIRGWGEVKEFLSRASGFITMGCIAVWSVTSLPLGATGLDTLGGQLGEFFSPIMQPIGIDPYLTLALIFGFIAKEVVIGSLAVIYGLNNVAVSQHIGETVTFIQGYSFCIFCLLYTPCLTTVATLLNESKSWKFTLFSLGFSLVLAWVASFIFYQSAVFLQGLS